MTEQPSSISTDLLMKIGEHSGRIGALEQGQAQVVGLTWTTETVRGKPQQVWGAPRWRLAGKAGRTVRVRAHYCGVDGPWVYA